MTEIQQLKKNKCLYIGNVSPTKRCEHALSLAEEFFSKYTYGKNDLLIIADRIKQKVSLRLFKNAGYKFDLAFRIYKKYSPALIWVDDIKRAADIEEEFPGIPIIYSCSRPTNNGTKIIVDSKEQKPLFTGDKIVKHSLIVGDYTTEKLFHKFHIERKSPEDLCSTITKGHARFRNELIRAEVNKIKLVMYVECLRKDFVDKKFPGGQLRQISGETLVKIIDTIENKYKMEVVWCSNRDLARAKVLKRLKDEEYILSSGKEQRQVQLSKSQGVQSQRKNK